MSRHRDIRNMDYSEDYDGYDDVYGHSVDDDICISPSHRQFMYNRDSSGQSKNDISMEEDIQEEDEAEEEIKLSDEDKTKLESCMNHVKSVFAPLTTPRSEIVKVIIANKFDTDQVISALLKLPPKSEKRDKAETIQFNIYSQRPSSQKVESQSDNVLFNFDKCNNSQLNTQSKKFSFLKGQISGSSNMLKPSNTSSESSNANIFLSKMKINQNLNINGHEKSNEQHFVSSLYSKVKSKENNTPQISFLSQISNLDNTIQKSESNNFLSKLKKTDREGGLNGSMKHIPTVKKQQLIQNDNVQHQTNSTAFKNIPKNNMPELSFNLSKMNRESIDVQEKTKSDISLSHALSKNFTKLNLVDVRSEPILGKTENGVFNINLSTAVQKNNFLNLKCESTEENKFDIPFICDEELDIEETALECTIDVKYLAKMTVLFSKKPSSLGRIFCRRFKYCKVKQWRQKKINLDPRLIKFNFLEPSPDDQIKKYIRPNK